MKVEELVIDGFKSYSVRTVITSWDPQFNAITGLNGSGKSNILDAICFVLGITSTSSLRASNLQDLIYKKGQAGITKASVTITFDNTDKKSSPVQFSNDPKISITRRVSVESPNSVVTKYLINGRKSTQREVATLLQSVQLNINNPNFLIMQGQITKMLNMKPTQILSLIEEAAGTKSYEAQRDLSEKIIKKKDAKLENIKETRDLQVKPKLAELLKNTEVVIEYKNRLKERDNFLQLLEAFWYQNSLEMLQNIETPLNDSKEKLRIIQDSIEQYQDQIKNIENDMNQMKTDKSNKDSTKLKELEVKEQNLLNTITRLTTLQKSKIENINELKSSINSKESEIDELVLLRNNKKEKYDEIQNTFIKEEEDLKNFKESLQKKEDLLSTLSTGISSKGSADSGYASQLRDANKKLSETKTVIEQARLKIRHLNSQTDENRLKAHKNELLKFETEIKKRTQSLEITKEQLRKSGFDKVEYENLKNEERTLIQQLDTKNRSLQEFIRRDTRFDFSYENPTPDFNPDSVKGLCGELFNLPEDNKRASTALEVCAGFKLFNVVVDTDRTGSLLLENGKLRKRVTIVPLNKISSKAVRPDILQDAKRQAPNKVELALNLVEYDNSVQKAIEYVFGNKLICDDPETAKKVTFNDRIRIGSITLDGDNYDPEGRLSGGSRRTSSSLINQFSQFKQLREDVVRIRKRLNEISQKLSTMNQVAAKNHDIQQKLVSEEYQINTLNKKLNEGPSVIYVRTYEDSKTQIEQLDKSIEEHNNSLINIQNEIQQINNDIKEFNSDGSKKIRELKDQIAQMSTDMKKQEKALNKRRVLFNEEKVRNEDTLNDIEILKAEIIKINEEIPKSEEDLKTHDQEINDKQIELDTVTEEISIEKERAAGYIEELNQLSTHLQNTRNKLANSKKSSDLELENLNKLKQIHKTSNLRMEEAISTFDWIVNDTQRMHIINSNPNIDLDEIEEKIKECDKKIEDLRSKGGDKNVIQETDILKSHDTTLEAKIRKIEKDKVKIQETIVKLDKYLKTQLESTYAQVSKDFGETFALLLPGSSAKLVKSDPNGDITKGLEVKIQLGNVWKESLVELSGGQRSLVALALIMSLLQFRPAPMYILDEVDAALDLSHTQSIGHLIKTRFKESQFIVVSLKEGMFTNANRLFKVRFQDGTSVVTAS